MTTDVQGLPEEYVRLTAEVMRTSWKQGTRHDAMIARDQFAARDALDAYVLSLIERQAAELEQCRKDAARYRYLRDDGDGFTIDVREYDDDGGEDWVSGHEPAELDEAVDAALRESQGEK